VVVGFFVGILLAAVKIERALDDHEWILRKKRLARDYRVVDLSKSSLAGNDLEHGCTNPQDYWNAEALETSTLSIEGRPQHAYLKELGLAD
jgi:hypothetical protein